MMTQAYRLLQSESKNYMLRPRTMSLTSMSSHPPKINNQKNLIKISQNPHLLIPIQAKNKMNKKLESMLRKSDRISREISAKNQKKYHSQTYPKTSGQNSPEDQNALSNPRRVAFDVLTRATMNQISNAGKIFQLVANASINCAPPRKFTRKLDQKQKRTSIDFSAEFVMKITTTIYTVSFANKYTRPMERTKMTINGLDVTTATDGQICIDIRIISSVRESSGTRILLN